MVRQPYPFFVLNLESYNFMDVPHFLLDLICQSNF
jgi:hypothetical protein